MLDARNNANQHPDYELEASIRLSKTRQAGVGMLAKFQPCNHAPSRHWTALLDHFVVKDGRGAQAEKVALRALTFRTAFKIANIASEVNFATVSQALSRRMWPAVGRCKPCNI